MRRMLGAATAALICGIVVLVAGWLGPSIATNAPTLTTSLGLAIDALPDLLHPFAGLLVVAVASAIGGWLAPRSDEGFWSVLGHSTTAFVAVVLVVTFLGSSASLAASGDPGALFVPVEKTLLVAVALAIVVVTVELPAVAAWYVVIRTISHGLRRNVSLGT